MITITIPMFRLAAFAKVIIDLIEIKTKIIPVIVSSLNIQQFG